MPDDPLTDAAPVPIRPSRTSPSRASAPPGPVVRDLHASLRATDVYVRVLIDRIELARTSGLVRLDGLASDALVRLTAMSDALQDGADRMLSQIDLDLARTARAVADLEGARACHKDRR